MNQQSPSVSKPYSLEEMQTESDFRPYDKFRLAATVGELHKLKSQNTRLLRALDSVIAAGRHAARGTKLESVFSAANEVLLQIKDRE